MISESTIHDLIDYESEISITLTMPTHKRGEDSKQDPIRLKNLISEATQLIIKNGGNSALAEKLLQPAVNLLGKPLFWSHVEYGLVIYLSNEKFDLHLLPYSVQEQAYVADHFLITPIMPMISMDGSFFVLAVSRQNMRLLHCTRNEAVDVTPIGMPKSVEDYLEVDPEKQLQFHSGSHGQKAVYFGHNANEEDKMVVVEQFFREAERSITDKLNKDGDPLIAIGLSDNLNLYKKINNYSRLMGDMIKTNPNELSDKQLKEMGWDFVRTYFLEDMYKSLGKFETKSVEKFSNNLEEIVEATVMGKSSAIFISTGETKWGYYDESKNVVQFSGSKNGNDVDLLNWLSIKGLKMGSKVYLLPKEEMPAQSTVAAEFRF